MIQKTIFYILIALAIYSCSQAPTDIIADKPLFRDPVFDGAADPVVIWHKQEKKWFMFYTNRRAKADSLDGVSWVHGTRIGIAESSDGGATWQYRDTCNINYRMPEYTHWAPEVIEHQGTYHMYLTYVPGIFIDWNHPRWIVHLTSQNLIDWDFQSRLRLASDNCIDACVFQMPDGNWRMYYNNEKEVNPSTMPIALTCTTGLIVVKRQSVTDQEKARLFSSGKVRTGCSWMFGKVWVYINLMTW